MHGRRAEHLGATLLTPKDAPMHLQYPMTMYARHARARSVNPGGAPSNRSVAWSQSKAFSNSLGSCVAAACEEAE